MLCCPAANTDPQIDTAPDVDDRATQLICAWSHSEPGNPVTNSESIHATALASGRRGILLLGPSGSGKSDLALRCLSLETANGILHERFRLVADDRVIIKLRDRPAELVLSAPDTIYGLIEVRGIGIIKLPDELVVSVNEVIALTVIITLSSQQLERSPVEQQTMIIQGQAVPHLTLRPFETSAAQKIAIALMRHTTSGNFNT